MPAAKTSKEAILRKSFQVFLEKGYYHTSVSDLSKACNIEKPHFYYYFRSKQDLMISILRHIRLWARRKLFVHANNESITAHDRLEAMLKEVRQIHQQGYWGCMFSSLLKESKSVIQFSTSKCLS